MIILGLNISGFHSSACLISNGKIVRATTEERVTRVKQDKSFPSEAIKYCCSSSDINERDITDIYIGWNPAPYYNKPSNSLGEALKERGKIPYAALSELAVIHPEEITSIRQELRTINSKWKIHFVRHHLSHLSNSFLPSGFDESDFFVADGFGENTSGTIGSVTLEKVSELNTFRYPHSLGSFYSTFTEYLGFKPNGDEWKVMALASLGDPNTYYDLVKKLIKVDGTSFELDLSYFEHYLFFTKNYYSQKLVQAFGEPARPEEELTSRHHDLVASVQRVSEETTFEILRNLHRKTSGTNIVLSGGFFMNSVLNGKVLQETPYENIYIGGSPDDSGIAIGAALHGLVYDKKEKKQFARFNSNYFGRGYKKKEITEELDKRKVTYRTLENAEAFAAAQIREKKVVAWFQGASEFGQRALGNRSILADPTRKDIKDIINSCVKYREGFRPFAPAVIKEKQHDYFIIPKSQDSFFMEKVFMFREEVRNLLPGVVHFDGSGRLQTVSKKENEKFYKLIEEFEKLSGVPIVLNTSFNINGMPLVETPSDAIDCFYKSGIDCLIMENIAVTK